MKEIDFERYLMDQHAKIYTGTGDDMFDAFCEWVQELCIDEIFHFANTFAGEVHDGLS